MKSLGRFGEFCVVIFAFSVFAACAPTMYSLVVAFQCVTPFFTRVPRYVFAIGSTILLLPLAIVGATHFEVTLINFLGVLGYWSSAYFSILVVEHVFFRGNSLSNDSYDVSAWNDVKRLPSGIPALAAFLGSFGLIIPCMEQVWFTGPIAKHGKTGDIGFEVALGIAAILYFAFRSIEVKVLGRPLGGTPKDQ
jgi:purine-cytosine permease-like protein